MLLILQFKLKILNLCRPKCVCGQFALKSLDRLKSSGLYVVPAIGPAKFCFS